MGKVKIANDCERFKALYDIFIHTYVEKEYDIFCPTFSGRFKDLENKLKRMLEVTNTPNILGEFFTLDFNQLEYLSEIYEYLNYYVFLYLERRTKSDKDFEKYMNDLGYYERDMDLTVYDFTEEEKRKLEYHIELLSRLNIMEGIYCECKKFEENCIYARFGFPKLDEKYDNMVKKEVNKIKKSLKNVE